MKKTKKEKGYLIIHRDLSGTHIDGLDCWCEPHIIPEDTLMTPIQIANQVSNKKFIN